MKTLQLFSILPPPPFTMQILGIGLSKLIRHSIKRNPSIRHRMGVYINSKYLLDASDLPFMILMEPSIHRVKVLKRRKLNYSHDVCIKGSLSSFLSMLHGYEDGDALFFSGEIEISGDTSAIICLRNALDDAEIDLTEELSVIMGKYGHIVRSISERVSIHTGLVLSRSGGI